MAEINIDGQVLHYADRGRGPAIVLVHGFPMDARMWDAQVRDLSNQYRVIAPDLPGFGQSRGNGAFTMDSLADSLHALLERLGAVPCVLGGLSMGGYVAMSYARKYPSELKGLMLIDTRADADSEEAKRNRGKMIELVRAGGSSVIAEQMQPRLIAPDTPQRRPDVLRRLRQIMEECPAQTIEHALGAMRDRSDQRESLAAIAVPTLIIVGEQDAITPPALAGEMQRAIPGARLAVIPDAGHMSPMEQPERVSEAIRGFVGRDA